MPSLIKTGMLASFNGLSWEWPPFIVIPLMLTAALYAIGVTRVWQRMGPSRRLGLEISCFAAGWSSLLLALDSPIHEISEQLFWVHMTQHEILMLISAPLLVLSQPLIPLLWALPPSWRAAAGTFSRSRPFRVIWITISAPAVAWFLHGLALWIWHAPVLFVATLHSEGAHALQHISFLGSALLFWWTLMHNHAGRLGYGGSVLYVFTTAVHTSVLGALLTFAPHVWYAPYAATAPAWALTGLEDQQIGGLVMWIPAGTVLTLVGLALLVKWLKESQRRWEYSRTAELIRAAAGSRQ